MCCGPVLRTCAADLCCGPVLQTCAADLLQQTFMPTAPYCSLLLLLLLLLAFRGGFLTVRSGVLGLLGVLVSRAVLEGS